MNTECEDRWREMGVGATGWRFNSSPTLSGGNLCELSWYGFYIVCGCVSLLMCMYVYVRIGHVCFLVY